MVEITDIHLLLHPDAPEHRVSAWDLCCWSEEIVPQTQAVYYSIGYWIILLTMGRANDLTNMGHGGSINATVAVLPPRELHHEWHRINSAHGCCSERKRLLPVNAPSIGSCNCAYLFISSVRIRTIANRVSPLVAPEICISMCLSELGEIGRTWTRIKTYSSRITILRSAQDTVYPTARMCDTQYTTKSARAHLSLATPSPALMPHLPVSGPFPSPVFRKGS